jgi:hypothetical protein
MILIHFFFYKKEYWEKKENIPVQILKAKQRTSSQVQPSSSDSKETQCELQPCGKVDF